MRGNAQKLVSNNSSRGSINPDWRKLAGADCKQVCGQALLPPSQCFVVHSICVELRVEPQSASCRVWNFIHVPPMLLLLVPDRLAKAHCFTSQALLAICVLTFHLCLPSHVETSLRVRYLIITDNFRAFTLLAMLGSRVKSKSDEDLV